MDNCAALHNKPKHLVWVSGAFYYGFLAMLVAITFLCIYWQLQVDTTRINQTHKEVVIAGPEKDFYVDLDFCTPSPSPITIERYYKSITTGIYYSTPTGTFPMDAQNCLNARIHAHTGRLEPGLYEYHVAVQYKINPLREERKEVATVIVEVK